VRGNDEHYLHSTFIELAGEYLNSMYGTVMVWLANHPKLKRCLSTAIEVWPVI
jgi:hypothetical protein